MMKKSVVDLKSGDVIVLATGERTVKKTQYLKGNTRVRITFFDGQTMVLDQFTQVEVA